MVASLVFAVVKVGAQRMGLIVDQVLGTEEIVVKPMHPSLKNLGCYAGATVMGDGKVALILNIEGIAAHAGTGSDAGEKKQSQQEAQREAHQADIQTVLLFRTGELETFAVSLPLIRRLEHIERKRIEKAGDREFITVDGVSTRILRLESLLNVSPSLDREEMYLLLPKHAAYPVGILLSEVVDIVQTPVELDTDGCAEDGILGSAIIRDHMTLFPDLYRLFDRLSGGKAVQRQEEEEKARILLVDDMAFFRQMVGTHLEMLGHEVVRANAGAEAFALFEAGRNFDLIVSDIEMPGLDGWEFIKKVRARGDQTPAIALTVLESDSDKAKARNSGFTRFEHKFERESFAKTVMELLKASKAALAGR